MCGRPPDQAHEFPEQAEQCGQIEDPNKKLVGANPRSTLPCVNPLSTSGFAEFRTTLAPSSA